MTTRIERLTELTAEDIEQLAAVLIDCVEGGASVSFMLPISPETATGFWTNVGGLVRDGQAALFVARDEAGICGTVHLRWDLPENQPHRADVTKLLVHRRARRQGIAEQLMLAVEDAAREQAKTLLVLDTASLEAERLYRKLGWVEVGVVPGFALLPTGEPCDTTYFYRRVG